MATGVIVGGKTYPLIDPRTNHPIPVFGIEDHHIEFHPGDGYNKKRVKPIDLGVFHWTGSENPVETMVETLRKEKLGVEFAIDAYGPLYQFCDPMEVDTADAGIANSRSFGVEIVNAGIRSLWTLWREPRYRKVPLGPREACMAVIHGRNIKYWNFYPNQVITACALNKLMVEAIPTYSSDVCVVPGVVDLSTVKGAIGHYNITEKKLDPGLKFMETLAEYMSSGHSS